MYKGIYIAASGAVLKQTQLEVLSENIANANTAGYKKDALSFKDYLLQADPGSAPDGRAMSDFAASKTDLTGGALIRTGNSLDIAIDGPGLIALEGDRYTRRGDLKKDAEGYLATFDGVRVLGAGGPIQLPTDSIEIAIDSEGKVSVTQQGSALPTEIDTIRIVDFDRNAVVAKAGNGKLTVSGASAASTSTIKQGYLESSNVNPVREMVTLIEAMREFETYQKAIQAFDDATSKVNNELGRL